MVFTLYVRLGSENTSVTDFPIWASQFHRSCLHFAGLCANLSFSATAKNKLQVSRFHKFFLLIGIAVITAGAMTVFALVNDFLSRCWWPLCIWTAKKLAETSSLSFIICIYVNVSLCDCLVTAWNCKRTETTSENSWINVNWIRYSL